MQDFVHQPYDNPEPQEDLEGRAANVEPLFWETRWCERVLYSKNFRDLLSGSCGPEGYPEKAKEGPS